MSDGAASLMAMFYGLMAGGAWTDDRASNVVDGGAPFYGTYRCRDDKWVAVGSIEPQFFSLLLDKLGITDFPPERQHDRAMWPDLRRRLEAVLLTRTQSEWITHMEGSDACFAGVAGLTEAPHHPHNVARQTFVTIDGVLQPAPAPRFSKTPSKIQELDPAIGAHTVRALTEWGFSRAEIAGLRDRGASSAPQPNPSAGGRAPRLWAPSGGGRPHRGRRTRAGAAGRSRGSTATSTPASPRWISAGSESHFR
jgi:alpha-methylacyl-CoA racemase